MQSMHLTFISPYAWHFGFDFNGRRDKCTQGFNHKNSKSYQGKSILLLLPISKEHLRHTVSSALSGSLRQRACPIGHKKIILLKSGFGGACFSAFIHNSVISFFSKTGQIGILGEVISFEITCCGNSRVKYIRKFVAGILWPYYKILYVAAGQYWESLSFSNSALFLRKVYRI